MAIAGIDNWTDPEVNSTHFGGHFGVAIGVLAMGFYSLANSVISIAWLNATSRNTWLTRWSAR